MHICGMDFSSLASYWQIKALLMLEPSVVTPQNQYFPANSERMSVHCLESGCIGKYTHLGPRDFPRVGILHPSALEIALGLRPRAISRASGCKIPALGKSLGPRGVYFPIHPSSRQCTDTMSNSLGETWWLWYCTITSLDTITALGHQATTVNCLSDILKSQEGVPKLNYAA